MNVTEYDAYREKKAHVSANFPYNTYICTIPLDFNQIPVHWHDEVELIVVKKGKGWISVNLQNYVVSEGEMVLVLPGQLHAIGQYEQERMEYENILFSRKLLYTTAADKCTAEYLQPLFEQRFTISCHVTEKTLEYDKLIQCIQQMDQLCDKREAFYELAVKSCLFTFFYLLLSSQEQLPTSGKRIRALEKLKIVFTYIEEHYTEKLTIREAADQIGFSESYFMKFFRNNMDMTFTEYVNDYRLTIAARELRTTEKSILEVAGDAGFENLSYFNRRFRERFHMTPRNYQK